MKLSLNGVMLKIIAMEAMIIDHFAMIFFEYDYNYIYHIMLCHNYNKLTNMELIYFVCRTIGRISFPIFAFLVVEGIRKTNCLEKYFVRMAIFSIIAEIPYNIAVTNHFFCFKVQNVLWLFTIGIILFWIYDKINYKQRNYIIALILKIFCTIVALVIVEIFNIEYCFVGLMMIIIMYYIDNKIIAFFISCSMLAFLLENEVFSFGAICLIILYDGKRGYYNKYVFYVLYPLQFLLIKIAKVLLLG